jgi:molybdopterin synthase catalytic subunit
MIRIRVLFFANVKEILGKNSADLEIPQDLSLNDFKKFLSQEFPEIEPHINNLVYSINQNFASDESVVPDGAEIAIFPPVSGGNSLLVFTAIVEDKINFDKITQKISGDTTGAICTFTGVVRAATTLENSLFETKALEYESYEDMAEEKLKQIAKEIQNKWPLVESIAIVQRIGYLVAGEHSVHISCSSSHRNSGIFEAVEYGINRLKEIVPVWKKEIGPDGEIWVEGDYFPTQND